MKRVVAVIAAFVVVALLTVAAQAQDSGERIFRQKCAMCHVVKGVGGKIGPELTAVAARMGEASLRGKLEKPKQANHASTMPSFRTLPKSEMEALLSYLKTLR